MARTKVHGEYLDPSVISAQTEVTAVGSDHMLIFDATDNALKKALLSDLIETVGSTPTFTSAVISGDLTVDTSTLKVDSSNNRVGIGTASPSQALSLEASDTTVRFMEVKNSAGSMLVGINGSGNAFISGQTSGKPLIFETNNTERFKITGAGGLEFQNQDFSNIGTIYATQYLANGDADTGIVMQGSNVMSLHTGNSERMRIDSSGRVLVGATSSAVHSNVDDLQIGNGTGSRGIGIHSANNANGAIFFSDPDSTLAGQIEYSHDRDDFVFVTGTTTRLRIDSDGLKFGSDTAAANALDDYEEGTWTPDLRVGGTDLPVSFQYGPTARYTKIGRMVHVHLGFRLSSISGTSGTVLRVYGLPFASITTGGYQEDRLSAFLAHNPTADHAGNMFGFVANGGSYIEFRYLDGGDTVLPSNALDSNTAMSVYGIYYTNA